MVSITVFQPLPGNAVDVLAEARVSRGKLYTDGPRADLIDTSRRIYSSRQQGFVVFDHDSEEWLRSFAESFRSAQVIAAITKDTRHKDLVASTEILKQLEAAQLAHH